MKNKCLLGLIMIAFLSPVTANAEPASKESIKQMMIKTGSGDLGMQVIKQMKPALKKMVPEAPDKFWEDAFAEVDSNRLMDLVVPVYQKYLNEEDIKAMNKFYNSPAGKKLIQTQPAIMRESMQLGQQWGQNLARKILASYKKQHKAQP